MSEPLLLYLDHTGQGIPEWYGDGVYGELVYGGGEFTRGDVAARTTQVTTGFGGTGFGAGDFGSGLAQEVAISRVIRPQDRDGLNFRSVRNGVGDWEVEVPGEFDLHDWIEAEAFILDDSGVRFRGKVWNFEHNEDSNTVRLTGPGPGGYLERGSLATVAGPNPAWLEFRDYINFDMDGDRWSVDVEEPVVEQTNNNERIQTVDVRSDFEEAFSITETDPFWIRNGGLEPTQTCFTMDATETSFRDIGGDTSPDAGEGQSRNVSGRSYISLRETGDRVEYTFEPDHHIPQARIATRWASTDAPVVYVGVDEIDDDAIQITTGGDENALHWDDFAQFGEQLRNIDSETTIIFEVDQGDGDGFFWLDVVAPRDVRYDVTLPNDGFRDGNYLYLDGPELYPREVQITTDRVETENNVASMVIDMDWSDRGEQNLIELSNNGEDWVAAANTDIFSISVENFSYGYGVQARFTFSWADDGDALATPRQGREPQRLEGWTINADMNDLRVIENEELTDSHFDNLDTIAERAGLRFYIEPNDFHIEAFHRDQSQDDLRIYDPELDTGIDETLLNPIYNTGLYNEGIYNGQADIPEPGVMYQSVDSTKTTGTDYANVVIVRGARDENFQRIEAEARDELEIEALSRFGRDSEAVHVHTDASIETYTDAKATALEMLAEMKSERDFDGSVNGVDRAILDEQPIHPGIEYYVDRWQLYSTLEEVYVDDTGVDLDFQEATTDQIIAGIIEANRRALSAHQAF